MPAYWLTDVNGGIDFGKVSLALYVRNVFDRRAELGTSTSEMALGGPAQIVPARPRTLGMTVTASF
jgi:outer membrane receptor protein involved in Fe transport